MSRFAPALRRAAAEFDLPRRIRTELLLEMAADLEAVYEHHRARGLPEDEAARLAEMSVMGSSEVVRRLGRLHASRWPGWAEDVGTRLSAGLDLALLAVGVLPVVALAGGVSIWALASDPSVLAWPILLVASLMTGLVATEAVRLLRDRPPRRPRLPSLLVLSAVAPALGFLAPVLGLERAASSFNGPIPDQAALAVMVVRDGATLLAGLLLGIGGLLAWLVLLVYEARRASREVEALLTVDGDPAAPPRSAAGEADTVIPLVRRRHG